MIRIPAAYYDGRSSSRRAVELCFTTEGGVRIEGEDVDISLHYADLEISSRLGNTPRYIYLPDGARLEVADNDAVDSAVGALGGYEAHRVLHFLESRYATAVLALVLCVGIVLGVIQYGIPWLARSVAFALPPGVESTLASEGLKTLDRTVFDPSRLDASRQAHLRRLFESLPSEEDRNAVNGIEFRASPRIGANAFALPAGVVVMTDELVELAKNDEELLAVMAHEIGHVQHRHILRQLLQNSMTALLVAGLFGDLSSIAGLSATLPTFLVQQKYTREFEREADVFAARMLRERGVSTVHLANILKRLTDARGASQQGALEYLSSHPPTEERIQALTDPE